MAYIESVLVWPVVFGRRRSPRVDHHRTGACPDNVVTAVVLAADPVEDLHVDGVGSGAGSSSSEPQATQLGIVLTS